MYTKTPTSIVLCHERKKKKEMKKIQLVKENCTHTHTRIYVHIESNYTALHCTHIERFLHRRLKCVMGFCSLYVSHRRDVNKGTERPLKYKNKDCNRTVREKESRCVD